MELKLDRNKQTLLIHLSVPRVGSATSAQFSNFFGFQTGNQATNASNSNFFGQNAGFQATTANDSNFFGYYAGNGATEASFKFHWSECW
jgi:hypothetical protein